MQIPTHTTFRHDLQALSPENFTNCNRYSLCHYDYCGLEKTRWMQEQNTSDNINFVLANAVKNYAKPVPKYNNSGWYIGSVGQWEGIIKQMCNKAIDFSTTDNLIGATVQGKTWSWLTPFYNRMSKVGYEYFWPKDGNNHFIINNGVPYIITSSVYGKGYYVTLVPTQDGNLDRRWLYYSYKRMSEGVQVPYCFPLISF